VSAGFTLFAAFDISCLLSTIGHFIVFA